jgi:carboxybiotin decarboxylase
MGLQKAFTVFGILAILTLLNLLVVTNPGMAGKIGNENISSQEIASNNQDKETHFFAFAMEKSVEGLSKFISFTGFRNATFGNIMMIVVGLFFMFLAIRYDYEPLLLIPIGTGIVIGNIPFYQDGGVNLQLGIYQDGSVLNYLYYGVTKGIYPPSFFLGLAQ